jgi:hypothetical protein
MKRIAFAALCFFAAAAISFAQDGASGQFLRKIGLTDEQIAQIEAIQDQSQAEIRKAQAELDIAKAQLSRLLLNVEASMKEIEKSVRAATEWEIQVKLAQIARELKLRKLVGDRKWRQLTQALRQRQEALREKAEAPDAAARGKAAQAGDKQKGKADGSEVSKQQRARTLLKELLDLLGETD